MTEALDAMVKAMRAAELQVYAADYEALAHLQAQIYEAQDEADAKDFADALADEIAGMALKFDQGLNDEKPGHPEG